MKNLLTSNCSIDIGPTLRSRVTTECSPLSIPCRNTSADFPASSESDLSGV